MKRITNLVRNLPKITRLSNEDFLLIIVLFLLQIADGALTAAGIRLYGTVDVEGNPLVKYLMIHIGPIVGLFLAKSIACILIGFVYNVVRQVGAIPPLAKGAIYLVIYCYLYAVVEWIFILQGW